MEGRVHEMVPKKCLPVCLYSCVAAVALVVLGLVLLFIWPVLLTFIINSNMVLVPDSHVYDLWKKFPVSFPIDFYFFNWTNPKDVYNSSVKPAFNQVGPYRFLETKEKTNITWNSNGTVTYRHLKHWYLDHQSPNGDLQDIITTVNPVSLSAAYSSRNWNYLFRRGVSMSLASMAPTVHLTKTVSEMLFEGYEDPMIKIARTLPFLAGKSLPPWDKFGWFYTRNGSSDYEGVFNMGTGIKSIFGRLYSWNHWSQTPYYEGSCGNVNGSAGEFFPNSDHDFVSLFSPDLCRTMTLRFSERTIVNNIIGNKYVIDNYMLDNGTEYPQNKCFCNGECVPSGLVNVSSCRYDSPSFASLPHFYNADPYYVNSLEGLSPDPDKHEFYLILEPTTGIPLEVGARLQINLLMQPTPGIEIYENAPRAFIPMLWFEQRVKIPDNEAFNLKMLLNLPIIFTSLGIIMIFMGLIVVCCMFYKICTTNLCGRKTDKYIYSEQSVPLKTDLQVQLVKRL